jgi:hypothetical protein
MVNIPASYSMNIVVEWLTFLLHIPKVPGSNLDPETSYPGFP